MIPAMPWWATYLPASPKRLATLDTGLRVAAIAFTVLAAVCGLLAATVATYRGDIRNKQAERALEEAQAKVQELGARAAPRQLSSQQRLQLATLLSRWKGTPVRVMAVVGSSERMEYALALAGTLRQAGWVLTTPDVPQFSGAVVSGVAVMVHGPVNAPAGQQALIEMLPRVGIHTYLLVDSQVAPGALWLVVGYK